MQVRDGFPWFCFLLQGKCQKYRRHRVSSFRSVKDITEEDLENVAITVRDKVYDKVLVSDIFRRVCITDTLQHNGSRNLTSLINDIRPSVSVLSFWRSAQSCVVKDSLYLEKADHLA